MTTAVTDFPMNAIDYLLSGNSKNLTSNEKNAADLWLKDWELVEVRGMTEDEIKQYPNLRPSLTSIRFDRVDPLDFGEDF